MDIRELISKLKTIRVWTFNDSMARKLLTELIDHFERQIPR
jgi:ornithine cyclodeaminase/alanine dehydrogenase-like protein (mu-crystallin family)